MKQQKKQIAREETAFGMQGWPVNAYKCPVCLEFKEKLSDVSQIDSDRDDHFICEDCLKGKCWGCMEPKPIASESWGLCAECMLASAETAA